MAFKFIGRLGVILASDTADDAQHTVSLGPIGSNSSVRVSEYGGQDLFVKLSNEGTAVTNSSDVSNGIYLRANTSIEIIPEERPKSIKIISATNANPAVLTVDRAGHPFAVGDQVAMTDCSVGAWNSLITNVNISAISDTTITIAPDSTSTGAFTFGTLRSNFSISAMNQTAGSDGAIFIEEIVMGHPL